jgi:hypothetical protein
MNKKYDNIFKGVGFWKGISIKGRMEWLIECLSFCQKSIEENYYFKYLENIKEIINNKEISDKEKVDKISYLINLCWNINRGQN